MSLLRKVVSGRTALLVARAQIDMCKTTLKSEENDDGNINLPPHSGGFNIASLVNGARILCHGRQGDAAVSDQVLLLGTIEEAIFPKLHNERLQQSPAQDLLKMAMSQTLDFPDVDVSAAIRRKATELYPDLADDDALKAAIRGGSAENATLILVAGRSNINNQANLTVKEPDYQKTCEHQGERQAARTDSGISEKKNRMEANRNESKVMTRLEKLFLKRNRLEPRQLIEAFENIVYGKYETPQDNELASDIFFLVQNLHFDPKQCVLIGLSLDNGFLPKSGLSIEAASTKHLNW
ncbi:unnamed protein product [Bemisia tabaci]|uniref:Uncharacterized protein n=1 Tax=Bemisia tabaci TaxID=7038 RepID=A0A9P0F879_BEMTA|nr:unnamed protein product [Bemisia tabaci]